MPYNKEGEGATREDLTYFYRITAIGFGVRDTTQVVLQTFYRKDGK
jgi:type IV pilus assembly protein PilX